MPETRFHQPFCRSLNIIRLIFFADFVTSSALWLTGGDSQYLEDNVTKFELNQSVFDLALIRILLSISFILLYTERESLTLQIASSDGNNEKKKKKRRLYGLLTFLFSTGSLAYSIVKCVFIIQEHGKHPKEIHATYRALAISSVAFSTIEFIAFFANLFFLKRMAIRYTRMAKSNISGADGEMKAERKSADLRRLLKLAEPVSHFLKRTISLF